MQDMFKERLNSVLPFEQLELGANVLGLFEDVGFTSPFEPLQEIIEVGTSNLCTEQYVSRVLTLLSDSMDDYLLAFGVEVTESTPLQFKFDLGTTLVKIPFYYLPVEVLNIIEASGDHEAILADLIQLTTGVIPEESLEYLWRVNEALVPKIAAEMRKALELDEATNALQRPPVDRKRISSINRLLQDARANDHLGSLRELLEAKAAIGAPYEALVQQYVESLSLMPADHMTIELLGLALFSNLPADEWLKATQQAAGEFTDLLSDHRKIEVVLNDYRNFFEM
jgi:hypothetical protein